VQSGGEERNAYRHSLLWLVQFDTSGKCQSFSFKDYLCNFGVYIIGQLLLLLRILKMTQTAVQLCDSILCDFFSHVGCGTFFDTIGKHF
jgi:hypothetical protein